MRGVFCDGSGWNDSSCAICVATSRKNKEVKVFYEPYSARVLEYMAILKACERYSQGNVIHTDAKVIFNEIISKIEPLKEEEKVLWNRICYLIERKKLNLRWIPREHNLAGIILESRLNKLKRYKYSATHMKRRHYARKKR